MTVSLRAAFAPREGVACEVRRCERGREEVESAARWLVARHDDGHAWRSMALVVPGKRKWHAWVAQAFDASAVPHRMLVGHPGATVERFDDGVTDVVHALSLYAAHDLDLPFVAIVGLGDLPWKQQPLPEAIDQTRRAMDAAGTHLFVSFSKPSGLVTALLDP